jgi:hypothetical protein
MSEPPESPELPQITVGEIDPDAPPIDWRKEPDAKEDDADPTQAPRHVIEILGFDPFDPDVEDDE